MAKEKITKIGKTMIFYPCFCLKCFTRFFDKKIKSKCLRCGSTQVVGCERFFNNE